MALSPQDAELLEDAAVMADFLRTKHYEVLNKLWQREVAGRREYAATSEPAEFAVAKGQYVQAKVMAALPQTVIEMAKRVDQRA